MPKVLITGGTGFIGCHLGTSLAEKGYAVVLVGRHPRSGSNPELEALLARPNVKLIVADLSNREAWKDIGSGYDQVYHLLSLNGMKVFNELPHEVLRIGIQSTLHLLDWFRFVNNTQGAKIVFSSTNEVYAGAFDAYGALPSPADEQVPLVIPDPYNPRWSYAGQKIMNELLFIHYAKAYSFRMSIARLHNVYGPRAGYHPMIPKMIDRIEKRTNPFPLLGPNDVRSFCFVDDAVAALGAIMESKNTDFKTYNVGDDREISIGELTEVLFKAAGWRPSVIETKDSPAGTAPKNVPNITKITQDTSWRPTTSIEEGLQKTLEWYRAHPKAEEVK